MIRFVLFTTLLSTLTAEAGLIKVQFSGEVTAVDAGLAGTFAVGQPPTLAGSELTFY